MTKTKVELVVDTSEKRVEKSYKKKAMGSLTRLIENSKNKYLLLDAPDEILSESFTISMYLASSQAMLLSSDVVERA